MKLTRIAAAVTAALGLMSTAGWVFAQGQSDEGTEAMQKVYITGSAVKHIEGETSLPVQVITRQDIDRTGATTTTELLNSITAASSSGNTTVASNMLGINIMSGASLRGMGYQRTLVLLNGRRVANNAFDGGGVDLETIPLSAVDRVEVLEDGASAVYGADAVGGVINFILKKDFQGIEGSVYGSGTQHGGAAEARATLTMGMGDLVENNFNAFVTMNASHDNALNYSSRGQLASLLLPSSYGLPTANGLGRYQNLNTSASPGNAYSADGTIAGNPASPNCTAPNLYPNPDGSCLYDFGADGNILPVADKLSAVSRVTFRVDNDTEYFIEASFARNSYTMTTYPTFANGSQTTGDGTFAGFQPFTVSPGSPYYPNQFATDNGLTGQPISFQSFLNELGNTVTQSINEQERLVLGTTGVVSGWDYDTAINLNHASSVSKFRSGIVDTQAFYNLTQTGLYNPFGPQSPAGLAALKATEWSGDVANANASTESIDLKLSKSLFSLPAGTVDVAVGTEFRREALNQDYSPQWANGTLLNYGGAGPAATPAPRYIKSLSAEANIPILKKLEADISVRDDHYSSFGNTVNPKVSFKWQPIETLMFRGSWGTGFRAPSLTDIATPTTYGYTSQAYSDPVRCPNGVLANGGNYTTDCNAFYQEAFYGNANLKPEKSKQSTLGFMFEPTRNLTVGVNYFHIKLTDVIQLNGLPASLAFSPATASQYAFMLVRFPATPGTPGLPGPINYVNTPSINEGGWNVRGADLTAQYRFPTTDFGNFAVKVAGTYYETFDISMAGSPTTGVVGQDNRLGLGVVNRWHQYTELNWVKDAWDVTFASTYWSGYQDYNPYSYYGLSTPGSPEVASYTLFDLTAQYKYSTTLSFSGGIKNIFDRLPPYTNSYPNGWNQSLADPRLRSFWLSGTYRFK